MYHSVTWRSEDDSREVVLFYHVGLRDLPASTFTNEPSRRLTGNFQNNGLNVFINALSGNALFCLESFKNILVRKRVFFPHCLAVYKEHTVKFYAPRVPVQNKTVIMHEMNRHGGVAP